MTHDKCLDLQEHLCCIAVSVCSVGQHAYAMQHAQCTVQAIAAARAEMRQCAAARARGEKGARGCLAICLGGTEQ